MRVMALGCFDLLHIGHVYHLQAAKRLGTTLIVALTVDDQVNKGAGRPAFPFEQRREMLLALNCVDFVVPHVEITNTLFKWAPDVYVKGIEYKGKCPEQPLVESYGGKVVFLDTPVYSSTALLTGHYLADRIAASSLH